MIGSRQNGRLIRIGAARTRIPAYASINPGDDVPEGVSTPEKYAQFLEELVRDGFKAIKLHTWMPPIPGSPDVKRDVAACAAVREAVGPDITLMLDPHHHYDRIEALYLSKEIEKLGFLFSILNAAPSLDTLRALRSNRLKALKGTKDGQYSIRINRQWRICFTWRDGTPGPTDVEIVDYH